MKGEEEEGLFGTDLAHLLVLPSRADLGVVYIGGWVGEWVVG